MNSKISWGTKLRMAWVRGDLDKKEVFFFLRDFATSEEAKEFYNEMEFYQEPLPAWR